MSTPAPPPPSRDLEDLRREVDRIDEAVVDLLADRMRVVGEIALAKRAGEAGGGTAVPGLALRPGREAVILRRLAGLAAGRFPRPTLVRMWRELLAATTQAQSPFAVAVHVPPDRPEIWDVARDHFGSLTPMRRAESAGQALRQLGLGEVGGVGGVRIAVLPVPAEADRWWPGLASGGGVATPGAAPGPRVIARLPFAAAPGTYPEDATALAVAAAATLPPHEPTGDDVTLVAIESDGASAVSRGRLRDLLAAFEPRWLAAYDDPAAGCARHLVELAGVVAPGDLGLEQALAAAGDGRRLRVVPVGCYARPLSAAELA